jgi:predicted DNA-binding ribbon-helix-helix protein
MVFRADLPHSPVIKRSVELHGQRTSVSLEDPFWDQLKQIAGTRHMSISALICEIDNQRQRRNLSSALRLFVLRTANARSELA